MITNARIPPAATGRRRPGVRSGGLRHILSMTTPAPTLFFGWITAICTVIAMVLPLTLGADFGSRVATAAINLGSA